MKKRILLFTAILGMGAAMLTSGRNGAAAEKKYDCTGAETGLGNTNGCASAVTCHGGSANTAITISLALDSAGVATTHYTGGMTYTVTITGTNTTSASYPYFGFQVSCIEGTTAVTTPTNAGTFGTSSLPTDVRYTPSSVGNYACNVIEHSHPIAAASGTGGTGTTYVESFAWTAPVAGTGTVSFWAALNAVPGGADTTTSAGTTWNTTMMAINEWTTNTSVANVANNIKLTVFPNPVIADLNLQMDNAQAGTYSVQVLDINGKTMTTENISVNSASHTSTINTGNWQPGTYQIVVEKDGLRRVIPIVKL